MFVSGVKDIPAPYWLVYQVHEAMVVFGPMHLARISIVKSASVRRSADRWVEADFDVQIHSVGIDLGKTTFHLVALGAAGKVLVRKKFTQRQLLTYTANMQTSLIGLEACSGAHFLGRALRKQGHDVRLIAAQFVKPFVKSNKNDFVDAEAIAEAVERKNMRFVPIKTDDQLDLQAIHRVRDRLISRRTAVINQLRAFLLERGMVFAKTPSRLRAAMPEILESADADLTPQMRNLIDLLWREWTMVEEQIEVLSLELERISATDAGCTRIRQIPGIGPIVATAIVAAIGNGAAFRKGRDFAAWLGLVPRQHSTGGKAKLLSISKRGNVYLRKILIHGARAAVLRIKRDRAPIGAWMDALDARAPKNVVVVATANKLARIAWAVLSSGEEYRPIAHGTAA
jgi:transposase